MMSIPLGASMASGAPVEMPGYASYAEQETALTKIAKSPFAELKSIGQTAEGRPIRMLCLSTGDPESKPAVLLVGSVEATNLVGSELAVRLAQRLVTEATENENESLLSELTFYIVPRPSPDASHRATVGPSYGPSLNSRQVDADRDGKLNEDPNEDLNADGVITMMRVRDPAGAWMLHPDDPRVLIRADRKKNEQGQYHLYTEGIDNDKDESWGEDGDGGVDFNRNFTFRYPYFKGDAGAHQISEPETRAIADFAMSRRNLFLVFSFAPQDNLTKPWKAASNNGGRIKKQVLREDAPFYKFIADLYVKEVGKTNAPSAAGNDGAFVPWAYFHYGRWSLATRGWSIPKPTKDKKADDEKDVEKEPETDKEASEPTSDETDKAKADKLKASDKRGRADIHALAWMEQNNIDGFVPWTKIDHADFPGKQVEVGGFKPLLREHPPADQLDALAESHHAFLAKMLRLRAKLELEPPKIERLGPGIYRLTVALLNKGYLPTASKMGQQSRQLQRLGMELTLPEQAEIITGHRRLDLGLLAGSGGRVEKSWLLRIPPQDKPIILKIRAGEPSVGFCKVEVSVPMTEESNAQ